MIWPLHNHDIAIILKGSLKVGQSCWARWVLIPDLTHISPNEGVEMWGTKTWNITSTGIKNGKLICK